MWFRQMFEKHVKMVLLTNTVSPSGACCVPCMAEKGIHRLRVKNGCLFLSLINGLFWLGALIKIAEKWEFGAHKSYLSSKSQLGMGDWIPLPVKWMQLELRIFNWQGHLQLIDPENPSHSAHVRFLVGLCVSYPFNIYELPPLWSLYCLVIPLSVWGNEMEIKWFAHGRMENRTSAKF